MSTVSTTQIADIKDAVERLTAGETTARHQAQEGQDPDLQAMLQGQGGWNIVEVLKTAAACALAKGLTVDDADVALVQAQLRQYGF